MANLNRRSSRARRVESDAVRDASLKASLIARRAALQLDVDEGLRETRRQREPHPGDHIEAADADLEEGLRLSLLQMRAETLVHLDAAIARSEAGNYGVCFECEGTIDEKRLHALPFAVRCRGCQELNERRVG